MQCARPCKANPLFVLCGLLDIMPLDIEQWVSAISAMLPWRGWTRLLLLPARRDHPPFPKPESHKRSSVLPFGILTGITGMGLRRLSRTTSKFDLARFISSRLILGRARNRLQTSRIIPSHLTHRASASSKLPGVLLIN